MNAKRLLVAILVLGLRALPAYASLLTYSTATSFNAANTDQTFQNISVASGSLGVTFTDALSAVVFSSSAGLVGASNPSGWPSGTVLETTTSPANTDNTRTIAITLPSSFRSVGFFFGAQAFDGVTVAVSNTGGDSLPGPPTFTQSSISTPLFFGVRSDTPFSTFTLRTDSKFDDLTLDEIEVGSPAPTPEAATMLLIATGLFMIRYGRRWLPRGPA